MTQQEPVICQTCHAEMEPGRKVRSRVMEWTEYICPNGCAPWSDPRPLRGHAPRAVVPRTRVKAKVEAKVEAKAKVEAEVFADELLEEVVIEEAEPEGDSESEEVGGDGG
jgi:hypothetical protein